MWVTKTIVIVIVVAVVMVVGPNSTHAMITKTFMTRFETWWQFEFCMMVTTIVTLFVAVILVITTTIIVTMYLWLQA